MTHVLGIVCLYLLVALIIFEVVRHWDDGIDGDGRQVVAAPPAPTRSYDELTERERHLLWKYRDKYLAPAPGEPDDALELAKRVYMADERIGDDWLEVCLLREELGWSNDYRHADGNP